MKPTKSRTWRMGAALLPALLMSGLVVGCDDGDDAKKDAAPLSTPDGGTSNPDTNTPKPDTGSAPDSGAVDTSNTEAGACPGEVPVTADVAVDTTWDCPVYVLKQKVYVTGTATLTIAPGVKVIGDAAAADVAALIVTRTAKLNAVGTKTQPIVFTSTTPKGGTWGGVVLLGKAKINTGVPCADMTPGCLETGVEGIAATETRAKFGGLDDEHNCGTLQYARIEFAGKELAPANELNSLTVGGCGRQTKLSYIQTHKGTDDGVEFFGGTVGIDHLLVTDADDDGVDWDLGWSGKAQFVVVHQFAGGLDNHGFEASGGPTDSAKQPSEMALPRSEPVIYNATLIGRSDLLADNQAMRLKEGTRGKMYNLIVQGWKTDVIDFTHKQVDLTMEWPAFLTIESSVFFDNVEPWPAEAAGTPGDDDKGFPDQASVEDPARMNTKGVDPMLTAINETAPNYVPQNEAAVMGKATPTFGDTTANYAGAFKPGVAPWTDGWTAFPPASP
jgi:hypothetical protein